MQKEIPFSSDLASKSARVRELASRLRAQEGPEPLSEALWTEWTQDLTQDDFGRLQRLAEGHLARAEAAAREDDGPGALDEARSAVRLLPRDRNWAQEVATQLRTTGWKGPEASTFFKELALTEKKPRRWVRWALAGGALVLFSSLLLWAALSFWPSTELGIPVFRERAPRSLEAAFDTQGVKADIQVAQSRLLYFPEATVAELSAWVIFPEHRLEVWEGTVSILDAQGKVLTSREVVFRPSSEGPLAPGQGLQVFQQFDAWPWYDEAAAFQLTTNRILAPEARPVRKAEIPVTGVESLPQGLGFRVWVIDQGWSERFASRVHSLNLELENTGVRALAELQLALLWRDPQGRVLKTLDLKPITRFRAALPPGGRIGLTQDTVFDTEVFDWSPGGEPHLVLELRRWQ